MDFYEMAQNNHWPILRLDKKAIVAISRFIKSVGQKNSTDLIFKSLKSGLLIYIEDNLAKQTTPIINFIIIKYNNIEKWHLNINGDPIDIIIPTIMWINTIHTLSRYWNTPQSTTHCIVDDTNTVHIIITNLFSPILELSTRIEYITAETLNQQVGKISYFHTEESIDALLNFDIEEYNYILQIPMAEIQFSWFAIIKNAAQSNTHEFITINCTKTRMAIKNYPTPNTQPVTTSLKKQAKHCTFEELEFAIKPMPFVNFFTGLEGFGVHTNTNGYYLFGINIHKKFLTAQLCLPPNPNLIKNKENDPIVNLPLRLQFPGATGYLAIPIFNIACFASDL